MPWKGDDPERLFLAPDDDLAPNRPGEALRARLDASRAGPGRLLAARLLGRRPREDAWRRSLEGEQYVGSALEELTAGGWRVVHSIPLPGEADIDHLVIGPGGVFCVQTQLLRRAAVRVGDDGVRVGRERQPRPYLRAARREAARAAHALSRGCGFDPEVWPVLVLVAAGRVETASAPQGVRVLRERDVTRLGELGGVLHPERVERLYTVARNRRTWLNV
ncbi:nuclease-related domain-containing protein [Streptomyces varsoviensis]|uniref:nuclease-related domain-containing protein n=1 Tax=Streptomyces varsoviensis TaxID=67373 RepID=UPI00069041B1|nr:nuclease-related domain-containing protein [Streptomyces varsoviensis]